MTGNADLDRNVTCTDPDDAAVPAATAPREHDRVGRPHGDRQRHAVQAARRRRQRHLPRRRQHRAPGQRARLRRAIRTGNSLGRTERHGVGQSRPADLAPQPRFQRARQSDPQRQWRGRPAVRLRHADHASARGANWSPVDRLNLIASWTREEGAPSHRPARRSDPRHAGHADLRLHHRRDGARHRHHRRQPRSPGRPPQRAQARRQLAAVRQDSICGCAPITSTQTIDRPISSFPGRARRSRPPSPSASSAIASGRAGQRRPPPGQFRQATRDTLRLGFDFTKPLKSRRPSQALIDQFRAQFGVAPRGGRPGRPPAGRRPKAASALRRGPPEAAAPPIRADGGGGGGAAAAASAAAVAAAASSAAAAAAG